MSSYGEVAKKLEDLRTLETQLWVEDREKREYFRVEYGQIDGGPTVFGRAAKAMGELLDGLEEILNECVDAEATAYATGQPCEDKANVMTFGFILETLDEHLSGDA